MAAVNLQLMANVPFDLIPNAGHPHSRSNSVSSNSSANSPGSRPTSSQGAILRASAMMPPSSEDLYRASFHTTNSFTGDHTRNPSDASHSSAYSLGSDIITPGDSPPNHNLSNPSLKAHLRHTHIRARVAASPYPRDTESVHSSSSETEDISLYLGPAGNDYHPMFGGQHMMGHSEPVHTTGAFGRMTLSPDHALEKLAANVRAATTTSASDRAKQIFVQAWYVSPLLPRPTRFEPIILG